MNSVTNYILSFCCVLFYLSFCIVHSVCIETHVGDIQKNKSNSFTIIQLTFKNNNETRWLELPFCLVSFVLFHFYFSGVQMCERANVWMDGFYMLRCLFFVIFVFNCSIYHVSWRYLLV